VAAANKAEVQRDTAPKSRAALNSMWMIGGPAIAMGKLVPKEVFV